MLPRRALSAERLGRKPLFVVLTYPPGAFEPSVARRGWLDSAEERTDEGSLPRVRVGGQGQTPGMAGATAVTAAFGYLSQ